MGVLRTFDFIAGQIPHPDPRGGRWEFQLTGALLPPFGGHAKSTSIETPHIYTKYSEFLFANNSFATKNIPGLMFHFSTSPRSLYLIRQRNEYFEILKHGNTTWLQMKNSNVTCLKQSQTHVLIKVQVQQIGVVATQQEKSV